MQRDHELGVGRLPFTTRTATRLGASGLSNPCRRGKEAYLADDLLQEAGDSLMMELGEAANRPSWLDVLAPEGVEWALAVVNRNFIIHQYDEINRTSSG